jgi:hypothetical protein
VVRRTGAVIAVNEGRAVAVVDTPDLETTGVAAPERDVTRTTMHVGVGRST